jgi:hypothetical protein
MRALVRPAARASLMLMVGLLVVACSASAGGSSASPTLAPLSTPTRAASSLTALDAAAIVVAQDPRFAGVGPRDPSMVGQGSWYDVAPSSSGWIVTVQLGWGDCQAGCISRHTWTYAVTTTGAASLVSETGDALPAASGIASTGQSGTGAPVPATAEPTPGTGRPAPTAGRPAPTVRPTPSRQPVPTATSAAPPSNSVPTTGGFWIIGTATAGPVCPVERYPPDPACAPRPVAGATITVHGAGGQVIATITTGTDGSYRVAVPAGGVQVVAAPVAGLMRAPAPVDVVVPAGSSAWVRVDLSYDTGIR